MSLAGTGEVFNHFLLLLLFVAWLWTIFKTSATGGQQLTKVSVALLVRSVNLQRMGLVLGQSLQGKVSSGLSVK